MKRFAAAAVAALVVATPALAQDSASFTGPRVEAVLGYDVVSTPGVSDPDGFLYGVGVGYDVQVKGVVLGLEGEWTDSTTKKYGVNSDRDLYVGGRIGVPISNVALLYGKVGYTNARLESDVYSKNLDGIRLGAGMEYAIGGNMFLKGEYRYSNYEDDLSRHQVVGGFGIRF